MAADSSVKRDSVMRDNGRRRKGELALAIVILGAFVVLGLFAYEYGYFQGPQNTGGPSLMQATCSSISNSTSGTVQHTASGGNGDHAYFLIVETDPPSSYAGMNGSWWEYMRNNTAQWPVIQVKLGQVVSFHVINCASSEIHGFQITYYDDISKNLISVPAGQSYDITFTATKAGTFRMYCGIFCSIHPGMQNGELIVS